MADVTELREANPVLPVGDMAEALAFWEGRLGFSASFRYGDPPTYAGVRRGPVELHLCLVDDPSLALQTQVRVRVENIEPLYREYAAKGVVSPDGGPRRRAVADEGVRPLRPGWRGGLLLRGPSAYVTHTRWGRSPCRRGRSPATCRRTYRQSGLSRAVTRPAIECGPGSEEGWRPGRPWKVV